MKIIGVLFFLLSSSVFAKPVDNYDDYITLQKGIVEYFNTGIVPDYLNHAFQNHQYPGMLNPDVIHNYDSNVMCSLCDVVVNLVLGQHNSGVPSEAIKSEIKLLCGRLGIANSRVCDGVIEVNGDLIIHIADVTQNVTSQRICGLVLQKYSCDVGDNYDWTINVPEGETIERAEPASNATVFQILHMSDFHYDPLYTPGKKVDCGEPLCCQRDQDDAASDEPPCGYWTGYEEADVPWHTIMEVLRQTNTHNYEYIYLTGDLISHRVWTTSIENNTNQISKIYTQLHESFKVPVFPVLGNHEPHPMNVFAPEDENSTFSTEWLFKLVAEKWSGWLPEETKETILRGGYYTVVPKPGFRVIGLNTNVCYVFNWWLIHDDFDPYGQLAWLTEVLLEAEAKNEMVHIISHIPPGSTDCISVWSREYRKILDRFANTVAAQFNGHTHKDGFTVYYNRSDPNQPINVGFDGASVTPYSKSSPSYKLYDIDEETLHVMDFNEWTFNITQANLNPEDPVEWYNLYSFKKAYGVKSMEPSAIHDLVFRMAKDHSLIELFNQYKFRMGSGMDNGCDESCQKNILCAIVTTQFGDQTQCDIVKKAWDDSNNHLSIY